MKKFCLCFLLLLLSFSLCGCALDLMDRQTYALCMSIDLEQDGQYSVGILAPMGNSSASGSAAPGYTFFSANGETLEDALTILAATTSCRINFCQLKLCVLGKELSFSTPLRPLLFQIIDLHDMRPDCLVMVSLTQGKDFLQGIQPDFGLRMSTYLNQTMLRLQKAGLSPKSTLVRTLRDLSDPSQQVLLAVCAVNQKIKTENEKKPSGEKSDQESNKPSFSNADYKSSPWKGKIAGSLPRDGLNPAEFPGCALVEDGLVVAFYDAEATQLFLLGK